MKGMLGKSFKELLDECMEEILENCVRMLVRMFWAISGKKNSSSYVPLLDFWNTANDEFRMAELHTDERSTAEFVQKNTEAIFGKILKKSSEIYLLAN